ncbi:hypothetical protein FQR65_LT10916 [Abscondita terminalis]|nr:hypothetical protein FQR65_LT10916 [Abscondita terminalis]
MTSVNNISNNETPVLRSSIPNPVIPQIGTSRNVPVLPPRPTTGSYSMPMNNYGVSPYSSYGYGNSYNHMGYSSPMYNSTDTGIHTDMKSRNVWEDDILFRS